MRVQPELTIIEPIIRRKNTGEVLEEWFIGGKRRLIAKDRAPDASWPKPSPRPAIAAAESGLAKVRQAMCEACEWFKDNANTGKPMPQPCGLRPQWDACQWRGAMGRLAPHPDDRCPWRGR